MAHADDVIAGLDEVIEAPSAPEPEVTLEAPADKEPQARADDGKFKGKAGEKQPEVKEPAAKPEKEIPLAAHIDERKQWKAERDAWATEKQAMEARLKALETPPAAKPEPTAIPAYEENPKGYLDAKVDSAIEKLQGGVQPIQKTVEQTQEDIKALKREAEYSQFMGTVQATQDAFVAHQPDYFDALKYIRDMRTDELTLAMPHLTPEQIQHGIAQEEVGLARALLQQGKNPHVVAYAIAQRRGYKPAAPALPEVPNLAKPNQLAPDLTLGSSAGDDTKEEEEKDPIDIALASVWKPQKRA